jgi:hypothetical protein
MASRKSTFAHRGPGIASYFQPVNSVTASEAEDAITRSLEAVNSATDNSSNGNSSSFILDIETSTLNTGIHENTGITNTKNPKDVRLVLEIASDRRRLLDPASLPISWVDSIAKSVTESRILSNKKYLIVADSNIERMKPDYNKKTLPKLVHKMKARETPKAR